MSNARAESLPELILQLDELDDWLKTLGHTAYDRVRQYRRNIQDMIDLQGDIEALRNTTLERTREVVWSCAESDEFVRAIIPLRSHLGERLAFVPIGRALSGPTDLFLENQRNSDGRNLMFELIMAGRFAKAGLLPSFDKGPDIEFRLGGARVAVQCKRPLSSTGLEDNIKKAISQLKRDNADLSLIAVSVSRLINSGDIGDLPIVESPGSGQEYLERRSREIADETRRFWEGKLERAGIFFYGFTVVRWPKTDGHYGNTTLRFETLCPIANDAWTCFLLRHLQKQLGA